MILYVVIGCAQKKDLPAIMQMRSDLMSFNAEHRGFEIYDNAAYIHIIYTLCLKDYKGFTCAKAIQSRYEKVFNITHENHANTLESEKLYEETKF
jgi:hypothetical protein